MHNGHGEWFQMKLVLLQGITDLIGMQGDSANLYRLV